MNPFAIPREKEIGEQKRKRKRTELALVFCGCFLLSCREEMNRSAVARSYRETVVVVSIDDRGRSSESSCEVLAWLA